MKTFKIKAYINDSGTKALAVMGFVLGKDLNAIERKMKKTGLTVDKLPVKRYTEITLFDYDYDEPLDLTEYEGLSR